MKKILLRIALGLAMGCTFFVFIGFAVCLINNTGIPFTDEGNSFVKLACCSMIISVGFTLPSIVYDFPKLARPMQILLHLSLGFIVFGLVAFWMGWIPLGGRAVGSNDVGISTIGGESVQQSAPQIAPALIFVLVSVAVTAIIWFCFYLYYKSEATKINEGIKKKQRRQKKTSDE